MWAKSWLFSFSECIQCLVFKACWCVKDFKKQTKQRKKQVYIYKLFVRCRDRSVRVRIQYSQQINYVFFHWPVDCVAYNQNNASDQNLMFNGEIYSSRAFHFTLGEARFCFLWCRTNSRNFGAFCVYLQRCTRARGRGIVADSERGTERTQISHLSCSRHCRPLVR